MGKSIEETNIVKGFVDDVTDMIGFHRPDEYLPTPADLVHALGLPTLKEAVPSPKDVGDAITKNVRMKVPTPPTPRQLVSQFPGQ
jgi:hypothetical protein